MAELAAVRIPMARVLGIGGIAFAIALPVAAALGWLLAGGPGLWGAVIGMAIPVAFFSITAAVALWTARVRVELLGVAVLGSWLLKLVVLIGVLVVLRDADFYSRPALFAALLVGTAGYLVLEAIVVTRTRVPYVEPVPSSSERHSDERHSDERQSGERQSDGR